MDINNLKACVVGSGFIGPVHAEALRRIGVQVVAVVTRDEALAKKFQKDINAKYFFTDIKKCLECEEIDTVHLCTPNNLHYEHTKLSLQSGKHVICEKPLAMDSSESKELLEMSEKINKVTAVSYNLRYYPLVHQTEEMIRKNTGDKIIAVHGGFLQDWLLYKEDYSWRVDEKLGGKLRVVSDIGTHWIDMVTFATGLKVKSVFSDLFIYHTTRKKPKGNIVTFNKDNKKQDYEEIKISTEDFATILIKFENGSRGVCTVSQVSAGRKCKLHYEIDTENTSYSFTSDDPNSLLIGKRNEPNQILIKDPSLMGDCKITASYPGGHAEGYPDTYKQFFKSVYSYIASGDYKAKRNFPTFEDGHKEMLICDAIIKSFKEERWVNIDEIKN